MRPNVTLRFPAEVLAEVDRLAAVEQRTRTGMILRLITEALAARQPTRGPNPDQ